MPLIVPDLSVIIVSYNTVEITRRCLNCIADAAAGLDYEVFVVDNNSIDGSASMVRMEFPSFHLIENGSNLGVAAATNLGLYYSRGRYLVSMNSDVLVPQGAFSKLVWFMEQHPDAGGATPRLVLHALGEHPPFIGNLPSFLTDVLFALCLIHGKFAQWSNQKLFSGWENCDVSCEVPCVHWGTCFLVRREVLDTVGMLDPRFFVYCEDLDWSIRIRKGGWNLYYLAEVRVVHLLNQSTKKGGHRMYAQMWKSRCQLVEKNSGVVAGALFRCLVAAACSIKGILLVLISSFAANRRSELRQRLGLLYLVIKSVLSY
ncbi:glycosyltransferase family 2 protein [Geomonas silvestris]|uniref:glycosyltransferase family 2 protein n=1 Tax=Geomonas silvestris TaxID=2740184 RepID=UPI0016093083|nr:glycosyltransferase family 2 protein [Geomonas silvestris]